MKSLSRLLILCCCFISASLFAQNNVLSVQGILKKTDGSAVPDDVYTLRFALYDAEIGGNQVWFEIINDVETVGGVYSVLLGANGTALTAPFNVPYYLSVKIGSSTQELLPRPRLSGAPYAMSLNGAANTIPSTGASTLGDVTMNGFLKVSGFNTLSYTGQVKSVATSCTCVEAANSFNANFSIESANYIKAFGLYVVSDRRTKKDFTLSDPARDLSMLQKLRITDYKYKDVISNGDVWKKGVIAQEVEQIIPEAVSTGSEVIPDIYAMAQNTRLEADNLHVSMEAAHGLKAGDKVRMMSGDKQEDYLVAATPSDREFTVNNWKQGAVDKLFVFGHEVNDFHTVDYDRLYTLNISATQELARRVEALEKENAAYKAANSELRDLLESLRADVNALKVQR